VCWAQLVENSPKPRTHRGSSLAKSLQEQLVEAGLASASQAKKAEKQKRSESQAHRKQQSKDQGKEQGKGQSKGQGKKGTARPSTRKPPSEAALRAKQAQAEKTRRDQALAQARNSKTAAKALRAEIKQLVAQNDQREKGTREDDVPYNFLHGKKIKRIYVPAKQQEQLSKGLLAIINNDGRYHLVSKEVAAKIAERDPKWVVAAHNPDSDSKKDEELDDYYKDFQVPDDLDW